MKSIEKEVFVCLDCESTGLETDQDRVIEIAVVVFTFDQVLERFETLVDPERPIPEASQAIHHITDEMVQGKPKIKDVLPKVLTMIKGYPIVGHGIGFDIALIKAEANRYQIPSQIEKQPVLDTLRMARLYGESPVNSLQHLREHFHIDLELAHRAMGDVIVNIEVFKKLSKGYNTLDGWLKRLAKPIQLKTMPLGKHKGRKFDEIPLEYLYWAQKKDFDQDLSFSIRLAIKRRKQKPGFGISGNPFADL